MAARFNADAAKQRNQEQGEGTPIHLTIPMDNPWVPLRILGLGKGAEDAINANVFLLTPARPNLLPAPSDGVALDRSEPASKSLLDDLRADKGMEWVPAEMWLTYLRIGEQTGRLRYDLAIDKSGTDAPSRVMAGLEAPPTTTTSSTPTTAAPPTSTTARPRPKPPTPTTARPAPPTTTPAVDPSLSVIVEPPAPEAAPTPVSGTVALPSALPTSQRDSGPSAAVLIAAVGGGALLSGASAWAIQSRLRRAARP
jgi:hypothetical protein